MRDLVPENDFGRFFGRRATATTALATVLALLGGVLIDGWKRAMPGHSAFLESLGFAQNFLSSCELEALHFIGIRSFGEEFREDLVFRGIQEKFRKPLA